MPIKTDDLVFMCPCLKQFPDQSNALVENVADLIASDIVMRAEAGGACAAAAVRVAVQALAMVYSGWTLDRVEDGRPANPVKSVEQLCQMVEQAIDHQLGTEGYREALKELTKR